MSSTTAAAMRRGCQPRSVVGPQKPNPGSETQTTSKEARSGSITPSISTMEPGTGA